MKQYMHQRYNINKTFEYNSEKGPFEMPTNKSASIKKILGAYGIEADFFGFKTKLPIGVAPGSLHNMRYMEAAMRDGFEVLTWKTFRSMHRLAHRNDGTYLGHNIVFLPHEPISESAIGTRRIGALKAPDEPALVSITNSVGMPSPEPATWMQYIKQGIALEHKYKKRVLTSVVGTARPGDDIHALARDYAFAARCAESAGETVVEINLSCPNVSGKEGVIFKDIHDTTIIARTVKESFYKKDTKLLIKLGFASYEHYRDMLRSCAPYIDGIVAINTIPMQVVDERGKQALPGGLSSGTCGAAIIDLAVEAVRSLVRAKKELGEDVHHIKIIGCGGVTNAENFMRHIDAGAEFVMCATAALFNPVLPRQIATYIREHKIKRRI